MGEEQTTTDPITALLSEFATRLNEIEEKQRLLRDRILLIGENLITSKENQLKENLELKKQLSKIEFELKSLKQTNSKITYDLSNFARKTEVEILDRQFKMFEPVNYARIKDIKKIVKEELQNVNTGKNNAI